MRGVVKEESVQRQGASAVLFETSTLGMYPQPPLSPLECHHTALLPPAAPQHPMPPSPPDPQLPQRRAPCLMQAPGSGASCHTAPPRESAAGPARRCSTSHSTRAPSSPQLNSRLVSPPLPSSSSTSATHVRQLSLCPGMRCREGRREGRAGPAAAAAAAAAVEAAAVRQPAGQPCAGSVQLPHQPDAQLCLPGSSGWWRSHRARCLRPRAPPPAGWHRRWRQAPRCLRAATARSAPCAAPPRPPRGHPRRAGRAWRRARAARA